MDELLFVAFGTVVRKETEEEWTLELIGGKESRFFAHHVPLQEIEIEKTSLSIPQEKIILPEIFKMEGIRIISN